MALRFENVASTLALALDALIFFPVAFQPRFGQLSKSVDFRFLEPGNSLSRNPTGVKPQAP